jgi:hypothetical protein
MADDKQIPDDGAAPEEGQAVQSVTESTPHPADESSAPGPYNDLPIERPPVSTADPRTPIAQSLVGGAGAPTPDSARADVPPEEQTPEPAEGGKRGSRKSDDS